MFSNQENASNELFDFQPQVPQNTVTQPQPQPQPQTNYSNQKMDNQGYSGPTGGPGDVGVSTQYQNKSDDLQEVMALWIKTAKSGRTYYTGKDAKGNEFVGFINENKKNPNEPDIRISIKKK